MTTIVDLIRKHQKMIVLGAALAVITLYIIPVDQLASALHPRAQAMQDRFDRIIARLNGLGLTSQAEHLGEVQYKVVNILESHGL
jgi:hypothetical protein